MPSTYSNLKIQLMATGENNTTWGDVTNVNLGTALEEAVVGSADVTFASANVTLTLTDSNASQTARNMRLRCTGTTGGSTRNLVVPSIEKPYIVQNACADNILVKTAAGSGITVPPGTSTWVYVNGTDAVDAVTYLTELTAGTLAVGNGIIANLTAVNLSSSNVAITGGSITGITDLAVTDGGTGQSSFTNGQLLIGNTTGNTLTKATLTAGSGISITNGAGSITIAATTSSADPLTLSVVPAAAPAAGSLSLGETTVGVEMLSQTSGAGWQQNFNPMIGRQRTSGYMFALGQTAVSSIEGTPVANTIIGTNSSRTYNPSTYFEATGRIGYVSAATAGSVGGLYGPSGTSRFCAIGSGGLNGFLYIAHFGTSDAATVSGARMFVGLANSVAAPTNVDPGAQTNQIGVAQLSTSNNLHIVFGGSSAQTPIDLGASFPANTLSVDMYELVLFSSKSDNTKVTYQVTRLNTGSVTSGTLTNTTPGTTLPATSTPMGIRNWRSNNATALAVGLDLSSIVIHQDF